MKRRLTQWRTVDVFLAAGLFFAASGAGLLQFPMIGLIGIGLLGLAFGVLVAAVVIARPVRRISRWQQIAGAVIGFVGIVLLLAAAGYSSGLAYDQAMSSLRKTPPPLTGLWLILGLSPLVPALAITLGLRLRAGWPWGRCSVWGIAGWCVVPLALFFFWVFAAKWPLTS